MAVSKMSGRAAKIRLPNFIIGGVGKAGTTSVFNYLAAHPEVCCSSKKETGFFSTEFTGDGDQDLINYGRYFEHCVSALKIIAEASPGYLARGEQVARRIHETLPEVKLLFVLRNPAERLYSAYNSYIGKLVFSEKMSFDEYVRHCRNYTDGLGSSGVVAERYLKGLQNGKYASFLKEYRDIFPEQQMRVMFFEHLREDEQTFMKNICRFLQISDSFYETYEFRRWNVTFTSRLKFIHERARDVNRRFEAFFRKYPAAKRYMLNLYKRINQKQHGYRPMSADTRKFLEEYYSASNSELAGMFRGQDLPAWVR